MKNFFGLIVILTFAGQLVAQTNQVACPYNCEKKLISQYVKGMRFYFPPDKAMEDLNKLLPRMRMKHNCDYSDSLYLKVSYAVLVGKVFMIDSIKSDSVGAYGNGNYRRYEIFLKEEGCKLFLRFRIVVDLRQLDVEFIKRGELIPQSYVVDDAVSLDEVELAQHNLVGNRYFVASSNQQKNGQLVEITEVRPGKFQSPLLIYYRFADKTIDSVYTDICHLNVPDEFRSGIAFSKYFTCVAPKLVQAVLPGMTLQQVEVILGKPQKKSFTRTASLYTVEYSYKDQVLTFENNVLMKIVSN